MSPYNWSNERIAGVTITYKLPFGLTSSMNCTLERVADTVNSLVGNGCKIKSVSVNK